MHSYSIVFDIFLKKTKTNQMPKIPPTLIKNRIRYTMVDLIHKLLFKWMVNKKIFKMNKNALISIHIHRRSR